jgi:hypothetical protein
MILNFTREQAVEYVNSAPNLQERSRRKQQVYHILYGRPTNHGIHIPQQAETIATLSEIATRLMALTNKARKL